MSKLINSRNVNISNSKKPNKIFAVLLNPVTIISILVVISIGFLLYSIYSKPAKSSQSSPPSYIPPLDKSCANSLVWTPLCFVLYVTNLNIDWQLTSFNLETFKLIQNRISSSGYKPKDLLGSYNETIANFNLDLIKAANESEKTKKTSLNSLTNWGLNDENKMFSIIVYLSMLKIVREDFIKNINQDYIDCMYSIFNKYAGGPAEYNKDTAASSAPTECLKKILPPS
jgi:hypothetical protein